MTTTRYQPIDERVSNKATMAGSQNTAPAERDPIEILMQQHEEGMAELAIIAQAAKSIQVDGFSAKAFGEIAKAVRAIAAMITRHNTTEETLLLPMLERHIDAMPGSMLIEHREVNRTFNELLRSITDIEDGRIHGSSIRELLQLANYVVNHLGNHMTKENTILFPMARRLLTPEEYEKLKSGVAQANAQS
jgi:hemerythrin-like domain-containing protein